MKKLLLIFILAMVTVSGYAQKGKKLTPLTNASAPIVSTYFQFDETEINPTSKATDLYGWAWSVSVKFAPIPNATRYQYYILVCTNCTNVPNGEVSQYYQIGEDVYQAKLTPSNTLVTSTQVQINGVTIPQGNSLQYRIGYGYGDGITHFSKLYTVTP